MKSLSVFLFFIFMAVLQSCGTVQVPNNPQQFAVETLKPVEAPIELKDYSVKSTTVVAKEMAAIANCVLNKKAFEKEIAERPQFDYTTDKSDVVARKLFSSNPVVVSTYCKKFTRTLAYRNVGSNVIYINICKQKYKSAGLLNTFWHERTHVAGYGHGDNYSAGKENSVPYGSGDMSEKYYEECKQAVNL